MQILGPSNELQGFEFNPVPNSPSASVCLCSDSIPAILHLHSQLPQLTNPKCSFVLCAGNASFGVPMTVWLLRCPTASAVQENRQLSSSVIATVSVTKLFKFAKTNFSDVDAFSSTSSAVENPRATNSRLRFVSADDHSSLAADNSGLAPSTGIMKTRLFLVDQIESCINLGQSVSSCNVSSMQTIVAAQRDILL